ncbi:hypothetical protein MMC07_006621 [Pseudocyphellaria aurata]|nr:hypothetical protein [Pseudocyphellaria aurata]
MADARLARSVPSGEEMEEIQRWVEDLTDGLDTISATHEEDETVRKTRLQDLIQKCQDVFAKYMNLSYEPVQARPDGLDQPTKDAVRVLWEHVERLESTDLESLMTSLNEKGTQCREQCSIEDIKQIIHSQRADEATEDHQTFRSVAKNVRILNSLTISGKRPDRARKVPNADKGMTREEYVDDVRKRAAGTPAPRDGSVRRRRKVTRMAKREATAESESIQTVASFSLTKVHQETR